jgi:hypothetical protein
MSSHPAILSMVSVVVPSCWVVSPLYPCPAVVSWDCVALLNRAVVTCSHALYAPRQHATVFWTHASPAACLRQLGPSLFLWSTARWGSWGMWQHRSSPLGEARPGPCGSAAAYLGREARSGGEKHVATPKLSSWGSRAQSHGTRGSARAHLGRETRSRAEKRVAAPELNSPRRRDPGPRATWQHQSSPQQRGGVRGCGTHGGYGAHLCKEMWSKTTAYVTACGCMYCSLS